MRISAKEEEEEDLVGEEEPVAEQPEGEPVVPPTDDEMA
jgi:hypothetical protein